MKKLLWIMILLFLVPINQALANSPYFGLNLHIEDLTTSDNNFRGLRPRLALGYSTIEDSYYWGAELFASPTVYTLTNSHNAGANSLRTSQEYGFSVLPGLLLSEGLVGYLRLGVVTTRFRAPSTTKLGGQLGVGLQSSFSSAWSLRGEYIYSAYSNVDSIGSPESDQFAIGLIYQFDGDR